MERIIREMEKSIELVNSLIQNTDDQDSRQYVHSLFKVLTEAEKVLKEYKEHYDKQQDI